LCRQAGKIARRSSARLRTYPLDSGTIGKAEPLFPFSTSTPLTCAPADALLWIYLAANRAPLLQAEAPAARITSSRPHLLLLETIEPVVITIEFLSTN
jgi:hypothetical protein